MATSGDVSHHHDWVRDGTGTGWVETRDAGKHPTVYGITQCSPTPPAKNYPVQNVNSATVEKP